MADREINKWGQRRRRRRARSGHCARWSTSKGRRFFFFFLVRRRRMGKCVAFDSFGNLKKKKKKNSGGARRQRPLTAINWRKTENYLRPQKSLQFIKFVVCCALTAALASPATTPLPVFPPAGESSAQLVSRRNETLDLLRLMEFRSNFFIS